MDRDRAIVTAVGRRSLLHRSPVRLAGFALAVLTLVAAACGDGHVGGSRRDATSTPMAGSTAGGATLAGTSWVLRTPVEGHAPPTLDFRAGGHVSGSTGCNRFTGTYAQDGDSLRIVVGPMTRAACTSAAADDQEQRIVAALPAVRGGELGEGTLTLLDGDHQALLSYSAVSQELAGTSWKVQGVNTGSAVETSALTEQLTLAFGGDDTVSGSSGCNTFRGTYRQVGDHISITDLSSTTMACAPDVADVEAAYLAALRAATTATRSGDSLDLRDDSGALQVDAGLAT